MIKIGLNRRQEITHICSCLFRSGIERARSLPLDGIEGACSVALGLRQERILRYRQRLLQEIHLLLSWRVRARVYIQTGHLARIVAVVMTHCRVQNGGEFLL